MSDKDQIRQNFREHLEHLLSVSATSPEGNYIHLLGKTLLDFSIEEKWVDFKFIVDERHVNVIGTAHGGIMAGLADECMGFGAASLIGLADEVITTSDMQFNCLKPIFKGDELRIHVCLRHAGKRSLITTAEIFRGKDLVFMATENLFRLPKGKVSSGSAIFRIDPQLRQ